MEMVVLAERESERQASCLSAEEEIIVWLELGALLMLKICMVKGGALEKCNPLVTGLHINAGGGCVIESRVPPHRSGVATRPQ